MSLKILSINSTSKSVNTLLLIPYELQHNLSALLGNYILPLKESKDKVRVGVIPELKAKKMRKAEYIPFWEEVKEYCEVQGITNIGVVSSDIMKFVVGTRGSYKFLLNMGNEEYVDNLTIIPVLNYNMVMFDKSKKGLLDRALNRLKGAVEGVKKEALSATELDKSLVINDLGQVKKILDSLLVYDVLALDIETTGLRWEVDELLTLSFAKDTKNAVCIAIHPQYYTDDVYIEVIDLLKQFFMTYYERKGKVILHNAMFDIPFLVHEVLRGRDFRVNHNELINYFNIEDTIIMKYVLYNSTSRVAYSLKESVFDVYGEYDKDIDQARLIDYPLEDVAKYNNLDVSATFYLYEKYMKEFKENEEGDIDYDVYLTQMNIGKALMKVKMNGMIINTEGLKEARHNLQQLMFDAQQKIASNKYIKTVLKVEGRKEFLIGSVPLKTTLFMDVLHAPVIKVSKTTGKPSFDKEVLNEYKNMGGDLGEIAELFLDLSAASIVEKTFLRNFDTQSINVYDDEWRIFSSFKQFGTVSGRLSSGGNGINFQNMPSSSHYGKLVKELFTVPEGYLFCGADLSALESRMLAEVSRDEATIKIMEDGYDSHCYNTAIYFKDKLEKRDIYIDMNSVESVNSIKELAPDLRQESKAYTFKLNYFGINEFKEVYDKTYIGVTKYYSKAREFATENGYTRSDFSKLRLWTPELTSSNSQMAEQCFRTMGNMLIQSSGFVVNRAVWKIQDRLEADGKDDTIKLINTIHDAIYAICPNNYEDVKYLNTIVVEEMTKDFRVEQRIHNEAELDIGTTWAEQITIPNELTEDKYDEIMEKIKKDGVE
jgi:DNA polymerase-1